MGRDPAIKFRATDQNLAADPIARQRMGGILDVVAQLAHADAGVVRERPQVEEWVERRRDDDALGEHPPDLGDALPHRGGSTSGSAGRPSITMGGIWFSRDGASIA